LLAGMDGAVTSKGPSTTNFKKGESGRFTHPVEIDDRSPCRRRDWGSPKYKKRKVGGKRKNQMVGGGGGE